jgi:hypothetical protein
MEKVSELNGAESPDGMARNSFLRLDKPLNFRDISEL